MPEKTSILILFAHPALQKSRVNRRLIQAVSGVDGILVNDLYEHYPDFHIDVGREQQLLLEHDLVVFQHPLYWYSAPALLKEWQDLVLEHDFAYGSQGDALRGKRLLSAITTGGSEGAYQPEGINRYRIAELLAPFSQTAHLCGMRYLPPFIVHGTYNLKEPAAIAPYADAYRALLIALRDGKLDEQALEKADSLNALLGSVRGGGL